MYVKRLQIANCGPIEKLDITFHINDDQPKPIVFVGENGAGKSIALSYLVNALMIAQGIGYPKTPEVSSGQAFKLRSPLYIKTGTECYFTRVDFEEDLHISEIQLDQRKRNYPNMPQVLQNTNLETAWEKMSDNDQAILLTNIVESNKNKILSLFSNNCILYFPHNRFEEAAWLNESNLKSKAKLTDFHPIQGFTIRKILNHSPLSDVQNWLYDLFFDRAVFELSTDTHQSLGFMDSEGNFQNLPPVSLNLGYHGLATKTFLLALKIIQTVLRLDDECRLGVGQRPYRYISIMKGNNEVVPNIFQLSSGETSLLSLFLSILRDFDLKTGLDNTNDDKVRGIVIVDEIDLHLHSIHQNEILPKLILMFPSVQFLITSHSPLFALGLNETLGDEKFDLFSLPQGRKISPEEFNEFNTAYRIFQETNTYIQHIQATIRKSNVPLVFLDGKTDIKYLERAAELLDHQDILSNFSLNSGDGESNLKQIWKACKTVAEYELTHKTVVVLHDCDSNIDDRECGRIFKRKIPLIEENPIKRGIENLFKPETIEKINSHNDAFIDIEACHTRRERGQEINVPQSFAVNRNEKTNLCNWICKFGKADDFEEFKIIFEILQDIVDKDFCA